MTGQRMEGKCQAASQELSSNEGVRPFCAPRALLSLTNSNFP
jgi:hypothetical protein